MQLAGFENMKKKVNLEKNLIENKERNKNGFCLIGKPKAFLILSEDETSIKAINCNKLVLKIKLAGFGNIKNKVNF